MVFTMLWAKKLSPDFWGIFQVFAMFWAKSGRPIFGVFFRYVVPLFRDLMITDHESSEISKSPGKHVHLNRSDYNSDTVRLLSRCQYNEYQLDVDNTGWSFEDRNCKEKKGRTTESRKWHSHGAKIHKAR